MSRARNAPRSIVASVVAVILLVSLGIGTATAACTDTPIGPPLTFEQARIVDPVRAGGEPSVQGLPDGSLLYSSHAGTTHLYKRNLPDADFLTPYTGADFVWRSEDDGDSWKYVGLAGTEFGPHGTVSGFSDPTIAVDKAGNVYIAGINLANVYVAKSSDSGKTWSGHPFGVFMTDREWLAADEENVVYLNGNDMVRGRLLWRSTDGGMTFDQANAVRLTGRGSPSPIAVDQRNGRLYFPGVSADARPDPSGAPVQIFANARAGDMSFKVTYVKEGLPHKFGFLNPIAVDTAGNVYIASNTHNEIRVSYSADLGETWRTSVVARSATDVLWPWIAAGDDGRVAVAWLQSDTKSTSGSPRGHFRVRAAQTLNAHGFLDSCGKMHPPRWSVATATPDPIHSGTICMQGLGCNASAAEDRRLGDYLTGSITASGKFVIAYGNTAVAPGSAISRPGFVRQASGVHFYED